jgi:hypothetical protein
VDALMYGMMVTDHCVKRVIERVGCPFDYDAICEQMAVLAFASGCLGDGVEYARTSDGTLVLQDGTAVTFLPARARPSRKKERQFCSRKVRRDHSMRWRQALG